VTARDRRRSVAVAAGVAVLVAAIVWTQRESAVGVDAERMPTADATPSGATAEWSALASRSPTRRIRPPEADAPETPAPLRLVRVRVRGRVVPAPGIAASEAYFFVTDDSDGPALASGVVGEDGSFVADVEYEYLPGFGLVVGATRAGAIYDQRRIAPATDETVDVEIALEPRPLLHGVVRDLDGQGLAGLGLLWVDRNRWLGSVRADLDPRSAMTGWLRTGGVMWSVTDAGGRFTVAQDVGDEHEPVSLDPRYALERASLARGTADDPFDVRARPAMGIDLRLVDDATGAPMKETARGGFVLRVGGRVVSHGALEGRGGRVFTAITWPQDAPDEAQAAFFIETDFHLPRGGSLVCRRGEGPRPTEVRFTRTPAGGEPRTVAIQDPTLVALAAQTFGTVTRLETVGGLEIEVKLSSRTVADEALYLELPQGRHRLWVVTYDPYLLHAPWSIEAEVPRVGEPTIVVLPPIAGTVRLVDPLVPPGYVRTTRLQLLQGTRGDGRRGSRVLQLLEGEGTLIRGIPEGDWVLVEYLESASGITERGRWAFHVDRDRETLVEMR
jgi:hypothetical protein